MRRSAVNAARDWTPHKDVQALTAKLLKWPDAVALKPPKPRCGRADILQPLPHGACKTRWQARNRRWRLPRLVCGSEGMYMGPCPPPAMLFSWLYLDVERGARNRHVPGEFCRVVDS